MQKAKPTKNDGERNREQKSAVHLFHYSHNTHNPQKTPPDERDFRFVLTTDFAVCY